MYSHMLPQNGGRHPLTAAVLSIVPGLGQFYVGDKRKGVLFLDVALVNYVLLAVVVFGHAIAAAINGFAQAHKFQPNREMLSLIEHAHLGTPASLCLIAAMLVFIWYAATDAYDRAFGIRRRQIYGDSILDLSEATSGSYVGHIAIMLSCLLMAAIFVKAPDRLHQITEITFEMDEDRPQVKNTPVSLIRAKHNTDEISRRRIQEPPRVAHTEAAKSSTGPASKSTPPKVVTAPAPRPVAPAVLHSVPAPLAPSHAVTTAPAPVPAPIGMIAKTRVAMAVPVPWNGPVSSPAIPAPRTASALSDVPVPGPAMPVVKANASIPAPSVHGALRAPGISGTPVLPVPGGANPMNTFVPSPAAVAGFSKAEFQPGLSPLKIGGPGTGTSPAPVTIPRAFGTGSSVPTVVATRSASGGSHSGSSDSTAPAPVRATSVGNGKGVSQPFAVSPSMKIGNGNRTGTGEQTTAGNPSRDGKDGTPTAGTAAADVDFSLFMSKLQRLIKRHWFPPQHTESNKIVVVFKVDQTGNMSGLRLVRGCGIQAADNAALRAIEAAAPSFEHLPKGAPESVDIEFTFDYNVFTH